MELGERLRHVHFGSDLLDTLYDSLQWQSARGTHIANCKRYVRVLRPKAVTTAQTLQRCIGILENTAQAQEHFKVIGIQVQRKRKTIPRAVKSLEFLVGDAQVAQCFHTPEAGFPIGSETETNFVGITVYCFLPFFLETI